jgi:hypothetical protein
VKKISNNILLRVISSIYNAPSIFVKVRLVTFARSTEYLKFLNKNPSRKSEKYSGRKKKRPRYPNKRPGLKSPVSARSRMRLTKRSKE